MNNKSNKKFIPHVRAAREDNEKLNIDLLSGAEDEKLLAEDSDDTTSLVISEASNTILS